MDPGPKVALSEFVLKLIDDGSSFLSPSTKLNMEFSRNGQHLLSSGPMVGNDNGCLVVDFRLIILALEVFVVDLFKFDADDQLKLGSVYLDLEDVLETCCDLPYVYDVILESEDLPAMQFSLKASSFSPPFTPLVVRPMVNFLAFEICSEETTDADFMMYSEELGQLLHPNIFLILSQQQFHKLRDRCFALGSAYDQLFMFTLFAGLLDNEFRVTSHKRMYALSRWLYRDSAAVLGGLSRPVQFALARALTFLPDTDAAKTISMQWFGKFLVRRHITTRNHDDLKQGIFLLEAVNQLRAGPYSRDFILDQFLMYSSLYEAYSARYVLSNSVSDLDMALVSINKAIELPVPWWISVEQRPAALRAFAVNLFTRFTHLGAEHDFERARDLVDDALAGVLVDSPEHLRYLSMREAILSMHFIRPGDRGDFDQAMKIHEELIATVGDSNCPELIISKINLGLLLVCRFASVGDVHRYLDLNRAIDLFREAVDGYPDILEELLGGALQIRFQALRNKADLDEAITILSRIPADSATCGLDLGQALHLRYMFCGRRPEDLRSAIANVSRAATSESIKLLPMRRFFAAQSWVEFAESLEGEERRSVVMDAFKTAMSVIPSIVWIGMPMQDRYDTLMMTGNTLMPSTAARQKTTPRELRSSISQTPNRAAAFAIKHGELHTAIEWLEQGRSIIWDQLLQFRVPLDDLQQENPGLTQKLAALANDLSRSSTKTHFWTKQVEEDGREQKIPLEVEEQKHRRLVNEWQEAVAEARKLPGWDKFLLPKGFDYLSNAANDGIVVIINISMEACDALMIFPGLTKKDVRHVSLPELTFSAVEQMHNDLLSLIPDMIARAGCPAPFEGDQEFDTNAGFRRILSELWYKVVLPVIWEAMEYRPSLVNCDEGGIRGRVRWCATGHLAFLPLHAAGDYSLSGKGHRVFDFVISSYIPTLSSIIRSTPPTSRKDTMASTVKVLAVACPYAKGQAPIPDTEEEVTRVGKHVVPLLDQPATPVSRYIALVKKSATAERLLEEMKEATWVHLACHGFQDATSPTSSALLLSGRTRLLLSDIAAVHLPQAEFAFLSACQTATGYDKIPSESVHLAAGMLFAGYRSVIGTMWSIADRHAPHVADDVYAYLLRDGTGRRPDYRESALALHLAMEQLRGRIGEESFLAWVPYIHIGA